jgi:hypothetical protein
MTGSLADCLGALDRCGAYLLDHQYTQASLSRLGLRALKGRDRAVADSVVLASAAMGKGGAGGGLEVRVAKARRVIADQNCCVRVVDKRLGLDLEEGTVFAEDGSEALLSERELAMMRGVRFYEDVVNGRLADGEAECDDEDGEAGWEMYSCNDEWWRDSEGRKVYYAGNEGGGEEATYFCYALVMWPTGRTSSLSPEVRA